MEESLGPVPGVVPDPEPDPDPGVAGLGVPGSSPEPLPHPAVSMTAASRSPSLISHLTVPTLRIFPKRCIPIGYFISLFLHSHSLRYSYDNRIFKYLLGIDSPTGLLEGLILINNLDDLVVLDRRAVSVLKDIIARGSSCLRIVSLATVDRCI